MPELLERRTLLTTIQIDYSYDTNNFFDTQAKQDLLQLAADNLASRLTDSLLAITPGPSGFGFPNTWTANFNHPATGASQSITDMTVPADTLIVFAGGRNLSGSTVGIGGPGGYGSSGTQEFLDIVGARGQSGALDGPPTDFGPWGGVITFDTGANWFFGETTAGLDGSETDFLSVAEHEMAHLLGFGTAASWDTFISGTSFTGANSVAVYGSNVPLTGDGGHFASDTMSDGRPATMTPSLLNGTRGLFTTLDFAGLDDLGWDVSVPVPEPESVTLSSGGGTYEVLIDGDDLVLREQAGSELLRQSFALVTVLTIDGSEFADTVTVLNSGTPVPTPIVFNGSGGNDWFDGTLGAGEMTLNGNAGNDTLYGGTADNEGYGGDGNDLLRGNGGRDSLFGDAGNDYLYGGAHRDLLQGGDGNDRVYGQGSTDDSVGGGPGDDTLDGGPGNDLLLDGGDADITVTANAMTGGLGTDVLVNVERSLITGGDSANRIDLSGFFVPGFTTSTVFGGLGDDTIIGSQAFEFLFGDQGNDSIIGNDGDDYLAGGADVDIINGGNGNDRLRGQGGSGDRLTGGDGRNDLDGGAGNDFLIEVVSEDVRIYRTDRFATALLSKFRDVETLLIFGSDGDNLIDASDFTGSGVLIRAFGGGGDDTLLGSPAADSLDGGTGNDILNGGGGNDTLLGGAGDDGLSGYTGNDLLLGGDGADTLVGHDGADTLFGDAGTDTLVGGGGTSVQGDGVDELTGGTESDFFDGDIAEFKDFGAGDTSGTFTAFESWVDLI